MSKNFIQATVKVDLTRLRLFKGLLQGGQLTGAALGVGVAIAIGTVLGPIGLFGAAKAAMSGRHLPAKIARVWDAIYRGFILNRFDKFSKGGGDWQSLSPRTIAARRKGKRATGSVAILRDTNSLFNSLQPNLQVLNQDQGKFSGIRWSTDVGLGGPERYPGKSVSTSDVAKFHQFGTAHIPQRKIIVPPDGQTVATMRKAAMKIIIGYAEAQFVKTAISHAVTHTAKKAAKGVTNAGKNALAGLKALFRFKKK
jgi:hypothetical protein